MDSKKAFIVLVVLVLHVAVLFGSWLELPPSSLPINIPQREQGNNGFSQSLSPSSWKNSPHSPSHFQLGRPKSWKETKSLTLLVLKMGAELGQKTPEFERQYDHLKKSQK